MKSKMLGRTGLLAVAVGPDETSPLCEDDDVVTAKAVTPPAIELEVKPCGNGHSDNPRGPLEAWHYGVHSHPCTTKLKG